MIRLEDFWSTSTYPVYYLSTGERIGSDEMLEHRDDIVVSFKPMNVIDHDMDSSMYVIGVELEEADGNE